MGEMRKITPLSTACLDWKRRIVAGEVLAPLPFYFPAEAEEGLETFDSLRVVDIASAGEAPTMGEISGEWIRNFAGHLFGSYDPETGIRHITEYFMLISKKNGKSTDAAAIMLTALLLNWRQSAEFLILAPTIEVANNAFGPARDMIKADEDLDELLQVQDHTRTITHRTTGATLKVVAADSETVSGKKATGVLIDELWLFGKKANAAKMILEATGGLISRPEGFIIYLSTQSDEAPAGVFKDKLDYARRVRDGEIHDPKFLPVIYEFPKEMIEREEHLLPENFYITNPNMGRSVSQEYLERKLQVARDTSEDELRTVLSKHLNVEIGLNLLADRWPGADFWASAQVQPVYSLDQLIYSCEVITIGGDGGGLDDLLGLCVLGREKARLAREAGREQRWYAWFKAWAHPIVLERRKSIATVLKDFEKDGDLIFVKRIGEDADQFAEIVYRCFSSGLLFEAGFDPNAVGAILDAILQLGVPEDKMKAVNQGQKLAGSIKVAERKLAEDVLVHTGSRMMNWCAGNAKVVQRGNGLYVTKQASGTAKIDPLIALFNAVALMALNPPAQYEEFNIANMVIGG
jgi:phage terminase large subunit-like protein